MSSRKLSEEHKAKLRAINLGRKVSSETREKLRKAHLGRVRSLEEREACSRGQSHRVPMTEKTRAKKRLVNSSPERRAFYRKLCSTPEHAEAIRKALVGKKRWWEEPRSEEIREKIAIAVSSARSRGCYTREMSSLHRRLRSYLLSLGMETKSEVRFGRYCVDEYDEKTHTAYEADGEYWHDEEYDRKRDAYLKREFDLTVVRFTEDSIVRELGAIGAPL